jgi:hypothetical protein
MECLANRCRERAEANYYTCTPVSSLACITKALGSVLQKCESRQQNVVTSVTELSGLPTKPLLTVLKENPVVSRVSNLRCVYFHLKMVLRPKHVVSKE